MDYLHWILLATSIPFFIIGAGFLFTLTKRGPEGVAWRQHIGLAIDRLCATILWDVDGKTICGHVGMKVRTSNNFSWKIYARIIEATPYWSKGHCAETAALEYPPG